MRLMSQARPWGVPTLNGTKDLGVKCLENRIPLEGKNPTSGCIFSSLREKQPSDYCHHTFPECLPCLGWTCSARFQPSGSCARDSRDHPPGTASHLVAQDACLVEAGCSGTNECSVCLLGHQKGNQGTPGGSPRAAEVGRAPHQG